MGKPAGSKGKMISGMQVIEWSRGQALVTKFEAGLGVRLEYDMLAREARVHHVTKLGQGLGELVVTRSFPLRDVLMMWHTSSDEITKPVAA